LYNHLTAGSKVYAPVVAADKQVEFRFNPSFSEVTFDHIRSTLSVKNVVFPKIESLLRYTNSKTESTVSDVDLKKLPETLLFGSHPCDNSAFDALRSIFCQDLNDSFFSERLKKLTVIGLSCHKSDEYCFCTSTGVSPDSDRGSDILLTRLQNGDYQAEILTDKGAGIMSSNSDLFEPADALEVLVADVRMKFSHEKVTLKLGTIFEHPFWLKTHSGA
jgi:hypothetical protein